mmetsp:Transcript_34318/g.55017  ORF Transcript_34318/g.55017 Transcript_34318/m.55017 type:complete len:88 (+) Transcript_34318:140-403(+)
MLYMLSASASRTISPTKLYLPPSLPNSSHLAASMITDALRPESAGGSEASGKETALTTLRLHLWGRSVRQECRLVPTSSMDLQLCVL